MFRVNINIELFTKITYSPMVKQQMFKTRNLCNTIAGTDFYLEFLFKFPR
jgi:hypothetical protein